MCPAGAVGMGQSHPYSRPKKEGTLNTLGTTQSLS